MACIPQSNKTWRTISPWRAMSLISWGEAQWTGKAGERMTDVGLRNTRWMKTLIVNRVTLVTTAIAIRYVDPEQQEIGAPWEATCRKISARPEPFSSDLSPQISGTWNKIKKGGYHRVYYTEQNNLRKLHTTNSPPTHHLKRTVHNGGFLWHGKN